LRDSLLSLFGILICNSVGAITAQKTCNRTIRSVSLVTPLFVCENVSALLIAILIVTGHVSLVLEGTKERIGSRSERMSNPSRCHI
jgi:hypothetical protein